MSYPSDYDKERAFMQGEEDAKKDHGAGVIDLFTLGMVSSRTYDPPKDEILRAHYDAGWDKGKGR
jgi:hypothetical protein